MAAGWPPSAGPAEECVLTEQTEQPDPAVGEPLRRPRTRLLLLLAAAVLLVDLVTKLVVVATHRAGRGHPRCSAGALYLTQLRNIGAAFSFAEGFTVVFSLVAVVVAVVIVRTARRLFSTGWAVALGLVLGGAVGNLIDRVFRDPGFLRGGVVDFLSVFGPDGEVWPVFNVADSAIVCGGILGALLALRGIEFDGTRAPASRPPAPAAEPVAASRDRHNGRRDHALPACPRPGPAAPCRCPTGSRASGSTRRCPGSSGSPGRWPPRSPTPATSWSTAGCAARATGSAAAAGSRSSCPPPPGEPVAPRPVEGMTILHDDDDIVVVDKPVGVAAHPSPGWDGPTVIGGLAAAGYRISTSGAAERQGVVHRLDAATTGRDGGRQERAGLHRR